MSWRTAVTNALPAIVLVVISTVSGTIIGALIVIGPGYQNPRATALILVGPCPKQEPCLNRLSVKVGRMPDEVRSWKRKWLKVRTALVDCEARPRAAKGIAADLKSCKTLLKDADKMLLGCSAFQSRFGDEK